MGALPSPGKVSAPAFERKRRLGLILSGGEPQGPSAIVLQSGHHEHLGQDNLAFPTAGQLASLALVQ